MAPTYQIGKREFIALMAALSALDAFSIDAMMPALQQIGADIGLVEENHRQYIITSLFLGFSLGVLLYGFISDRIGRRVPIIAGILIYSVASLLCIFADSLTMLLIGRALQGVGAAGPYVLSIAIVRDRFEGRDMAEIMSLIMMVFIGIPMIAPFIGQGIMLVAGWRSIFIILALYGVFVLLWFWVRQQETLEPQKRIQVTTASITAIIVEVLTEPRTVYYLIALSVISSAFITYLSTAQQVFQQIYDLGTKFPLIIALLASTYGIACFFNSRFVQKLGMAKLVRISLLSIIGVSAVYVVLLLSLPSRPPLWVHLVYMGTIIFWFGFLFENVITLALEPMNHIAGSATSVVTSISTFVAITLSTLIGSYLDKSVMPIVLGFLIFSIVAWWVCLRAEVIRQGLLNTASK